MFTNRFAHLHGPAWAFTKFCLPLLAVSALLVVLVSRQGLRFRISETSPRLDGTYQVVLQANAMLDKNAKPVVTLEPQADTETIVLGNRITVISTQPLLSDTSYTLTISGTATAIGNQQSKPSVETFETIPALAYGIRRTGGADSIESVTIKDSRLETKTVLMSNKILMLGNSPDYIWWTALNDDKSHNLNVFDKKSKSQTTLPIPAQSTIESLSVSKETNEALCIVTSTTQNGSEPLANEHSVYLINADQKTANKQAPPMDTAALALLSPDGSVLITQGRDGNVFARSLAEDAPTPLGRTRLVGPFSGDSASVLLRALDSTSIYRLESAQRETIESVPSYAAQVQTSYNGRQFLYATTDFVQNQSGQARLYKTATEGEAKQLYDLPPDTYSSRVTSVPTMQYTAVEIFKKAAQFDDYTGNSKAKDTVTAILDADGKTLGDVPLLDLQWQ